ncbi:MAG: hypothetical protein MUF21_03605 [Gemmatimonadaceae bacterium]|nr:hypothetical protein [Gemmatimonadaceae bacterium]
MRTLFVARDLTTARDQLDARALAGEDMLGWEPATLRTIAAALAAAPLADERRDACDDIALVECTGAALDGAIAARAIAPSWRAHAARLGFRDALHGALMELRGAGVGVAMLHELPEHAIAALLAATLARYEATLAERGLADPAHVTATALAAFDDEAPFALGDARIVVQGGLRADGLAGALLDRLLAFGAAREPHDTGGDAPHDATRGRDWTLRCAATPDDEVRAVLRDALARGLRWDAIELAVSDVGTWSVAAHAVCTTLGVPLTIAPGLPLRRARIGRAFARWLGFVREGLEARALWTALLEGDACLDPATHAVTPVQLAHDLRDLGVGWGRERWDAARARLADGSWRDACLAPRDDGQPAMTAEEGTARADALAHFLHAVLDRMPMLPRRGALDDVPTSAAAFATAALDWLALVAHATPGDEGPVLERVRARLQRIAERDHDLRPGALALAVVEQALDDVRWWPVWRAQGEIVVPPSRRAEPGALHLVELRDAGTSGRPHVRLLGLDARRCGGGAKREPLLGESLREAINAVAGATLLPLAEARLRERRARIDWALARLGGRDVALSWCAPDGDAAADACVLDALRARDGMRDAAMRGCTRCTATPRGASCGRRCTPRSRCSPARRAMRRRSSPRPAARATTISPRSA